MLFNVITGKSETFTCKLCNKQYTSSKSLLKHESKQHGAPLQVATKECETKNMFKCSCCKAPFQSKDDCIIHQHNEHADKLSNKAVKKLQLRL